ncbi:flagellar FlbD family protein [Lacisediminihabitans changchengi]|uniref:Flagellar FlbD family protein n=1 Tax=Lacisediminihabitans changchengi TaxID=2787634 RepID=A0A934W381_9MICO|nr:flagellar FlbD family protein [Lacisediminihabitans changchengi]MBK4348678.1 flagellar FlbD family protein [Lacisediminihabitans changchengi]
MIVVTRLNATQFAINPDLIERIHSNPDTTLVMVDGAKYIVTESMSEVIERITNYRATVIALTQQFSSTGYLSGPRALGLVDDFDEAAAPDAAPARPRKI